jgi:putative cell wall-binding protein
VFLATGMLFADALGGGVLAGRTGSSLLLVGREVLPTETAAELERLEPAEVVILGGTAAVSDAVSTAVADLTGVTPRRLAGPDRFGTAARIAGELDGVDVAFVATGANYADALAGVPVAIREDGAILLAMRDFVPTATATALTALQPDQVVVLGGTAVISDATLAALRGQ